MAALLPGAALLVAGSSAAEKATHGLARRSLQWCGVVRSSAIQSRDLVVIVLFCKAKVSLCY